MVSHCMMWLLMAAWWFAEWSAVPAAAVSSCFSLPLCSLWRTGSASAGCQGTSCYGSHQTV